MLFVLVSSALAADLAVTGTCPGSVQFSATGLTPSSSVAVLSGALGGATVVPGGSCAGTPLDLDVATAQVVQSGPTGRFVRTVVLPAAVCGRDSQVLDLATCAASPTSPLASDGALRFDGADSVVLGGTAARSLLNGFTVEAWARTTATNTDTVLVGSHVCGVYAGWFLGVFDDRASFYLDHDDPAGGYGARLFGPTVNDGVWHHLAATYDGAVMTLYVDGAPVDSQQRAYVSEAGVDWTVGSADAVCAGFTGDIDEVAVWSIPRDAAQIAADLNELPVPGEAGLLSAYDFRTGGQNLWDRTGSSTGLLGATAQAEAADPVWIAGR